MRKVNRDYLAGLSIHALDDRIGLCTKYIMELDEERAEHVRSLEMTKHEKDKRYTISLTGSKYNVCPNFPCRSIWSE